MEPGFLPDIETPLMGQSNLTSGREQDVVASQLMQGKKASKDAGSAQGPSSPGASLGGALSGEGLDSRLLAASSLSGKKKEDEEGKDGADQKKSDEKDSPAAGSLAKKDAGKTDKNLRAAKAAGKKAAAQNAAKAAGSKLSVDGFKMWTARLLFEDWKLALETSGISTPLLWLHGNLHWFALAILGPDKVCRFGEEFVLGLPGGGQVNQAMSAPGAGEALKNKIDKLVASVGLLEKLAIVILNILVIIAILVSLIFIVTLSAWYIIVWMGIKWGAEGVWDWATGLFG